MMFGFDLAASPRLPFRGVRVRCSQRGEAQLKVAFVLIFARSKVREQAEPFFKHLNANLWRRSFLGR